MDKIKTIDGEKYYHDSNVAGLMALAFFVGSLIGPFAGALFVYLIK